jgi:hypothetical protein
MRDLILAHIRLLDLCSYKSGVTARLAELYISRIMCLNGVPKKIVSEKGTQFTS